MYGQHLESVYVCYITYHFDMESDYKVSCSYCDIHQKHFCKEKLTALGLLGLALTV